MKIKSHFLILNLIVITSSLNFSFASAAINPEAEYWTAEEMSELSQISFREAQELCGDTNPSCWSSYYMDRSSRGSIYEALDVYEYPKLVITAVNPSKGKIKFIYYNEDKRAKYFGGEEAPATLQHIYIGRIEGPSDKNYSPWNDIENVVHSRNTTRNIFMTFRWDADDENHIEILPNVEQEVDAENLDLSPNINNKFYFVFEDSNSNYRDVYRLSDCLADYKEGTECQIRYSSWGEIYIPVETDTAIAPIREEPITKEFVTTERPTAEITTPDTGSPTYRQASMSGVSQQSVIVLIVSIVTFFIKKVLTNLKM